MGLMIKWMETGQYLLEIWSPNPLFIPCQSAQIIDVGVGGVQLLELPFMILEICPLLQVDIGTPWLRTCFNNQYFVEYCNIGTAAAADAYLEIQLPPDLSMSSSTLPWVQAQ